MKRQRDDDAEACAEDGAAVTPSGEAASEGEGALPSDEAATPEASASAAAAAAVPASASASEPADAASRRPFDADELRFATLWYYEDQQLQLQGPFSSVDMRAWFTAGYLPPSATRVAPSFYGEVPSELWPIAALWADPDTEAFEAAGELVAASATAVQDRGPEFVESASFCGAKAGYAFKTEVYGTGYYRDEPPPVEITAADIEEQNERRKQAALSFRAGNSGMPKFDLIAS